MHDWAQLANATAAGLLFGRWAVPLTCALLIGVALLWRRAQPDKEEHEFRRTYEASGEAVYNALRGALADLNYRVKTASPGTGEVQFRAGLPGPWLGSWGGATGTARVDRGADGSTELVISVWLLPLENPVWGGHRAALPWGFWNTGAPVAPPLRAKRIFDRVQATVVTYSMLDSAPMSR